MNRAPGKTSRTNCTRGSSPSPVQRTSLNPARRVPGGTRSSVSSTKRLMPLRLACGSKPPMPNQADVGCSVPVRCDSAHSVLWYSNKCRITCLFSPRMTTPGDALRMPWSRVEPDRPQVRMKT